MATAGRKRKSGAREKNGRLSRKGSAAGPDRGSEKAQSKHSVYGTDGSDAIGRAYVAGLLGDDGLNLRDTARRIFRAYWSMFGIGLERSCLGDRTGSAVIVEPLDPDDQQRMIDREHWLTETLKRVDRMDKTMRTRRAFNQLVIDINPDVGPRWLDSLLWHKARGMTLPLADMHALGMAIEALVEIAE